MRRLLVTGASGFIGTHCLDLVAKGDWDEIHAVSQRGHGPRVAGVAWHGADLRSASEATRLVDAVRPSHLFHAAWMATPGVYPNSPENVAWLTAGIAMVREFAARGGRRFVGVGSSAEYAPSDAPCAEDVTALRPASIYGKCKVALWLAVEAIAQHSAMQAAWGRLFLPYGPGDPPARLVPTALAALRARKPLALSHGEQQRDFIYAPDAAKLLVRLLDAPVCGAFNIASGTPRSVRSVMLALADRLDARDCLRFGELPLRENEPEVLVADLRKVGDQLSPDAPTPLADALEVLISATGDSIGTRNAAPS
jgi:nucleoside-diphosphate-sugar epimerase